MEIISIILLTASVLSALGVIWKILGLRIWRKYQKMKQEYNAFQSCLPAIMELVEQLKPNGGGSFKDSLDRVENVLNRVSLQNTLMANTVGAGYFEADSRGLCTKISAKWTEYTGLSEENTMGNNWINGIHVDDHEQVFSSWQEAVTQKRDFNSCHRLVNRSGEETSICFQASPVVGPEGDVLGFVGYFKEADHLHEAG